MVFLQGGYEVFLTEHTSEGEWEQRAHKPVTMRPRPICSYMFCMFLLCVAELEGSIKADLRFKTAEKVD